MGLRVSVLMPATVAVVVMLASPYAAAQTCEQLWVERNSYYKAHSYCFKTQRAIQHFGNGGCFIHNEGDVPLTAAERRRIDEIRGLERRISCSEEGAGSTPGAMSCQQLWIERNSIYKAKGYCFKTRRAIEYFGNGSCFIQNEPDIPFTPAERAHIDQLVALERDYGCD